MCIDSVSEAAHFHNHLAAIPSVSVVCGAHTVPDTAASVPTFSGAVREKGLRGHCLPWQRCSRGPSLRHLPAGTQRLPARLFWVLVKSVQTCCHTFGLAEEPGTGALPLVPGPVSATEREPKHPRPTTGLWTLPNENTGRVM